MMKFWANFAKNGAPGKSTNSVAWTAYNPSKQSESNFIILDNRKSLRMSSDNISFESLIYGLHKEDKITDLEKCVVLLQMLTFDDDLYDEYIDTYPDYCDRSKSQKFLKDNASFVDY
jgi:hypothetical protein